jgi:hypothetical protein
VFRLDEAARLRCVPDARLGPQAREANIAKLRGLLGRPQYQPPLN